MNIKFWLLFLLSSALCLLGFSLGFTKDDSRIVLIFIVVAMTVWSFGSWHGGALTTVGIILGLSTSTLTMFVVSMICWLTGVMMGCEGLFLKRKMIY